MPLPVKFDANEWFILISLIITYSIIVILPVQFPTIITMLIFLTGGIIAMMADMTLAIPPFELYDINDTPKFDLFDFISWFLYPPFSYFIVYIYRRYRIRGIGIALYILGWTIFALLFERLCVWFHVFHYKGWTAWYSIPVYLLATSLFLIFYHFIMWNFELCKQKAKRMQPSNLKNA